MHALMQDRQLLVSSLLTHAERFHPRGEIVSHMVEGGTTRTDWAGIAARARRLARALRRLGVRPGHRVATLAWNTTRHLELYFAVTGLGAVLHTINPRLFPAQIAWIADHGGAEILFADADLAHIIAEQRAAAPALRAVAAMTDAAHMPPAPADALCYEDLLAAEDDGPFDWPGFDETRAATLCYTSGTTGDPKGVLSSHRACLLHAWLCCTVDGLGVNKRDRTLLATPLFHVNGWGLPFASAMCGAALVLPGPHVDGATLHALAMEERCTFSLAVPTVWLSFFRHLDDAGLDPAALPLERVMLGGAAPPRELLRRFRAAGIDAMQAWGMTETGPVAAVCRPLPEHEGLTGEALLDLRARSGRAMYGVDMRIVDEAGRPLPHDGESAGHLQASGPWVASGYFRGAGGDVLEDGRWFPTGDVAVIDPEGFVRLTDRAKDVIDGLSRKKDA